MDAIVKRALAKQSAGDELNKKEQEALAKYELDKKALEAMVTGDEKPEQKDLKSKKFQIPVRHTVRGVIVRVEEAREGEDEIAHISVRSVGERVSSRFGVPEFVETALLDDLEAKELDRDLMLLKSEVIEFSFEARVAGKTGWEVDGEWFSHARTASSIRWAFLEDAEAFAEEHEIAVARQDKQAELTTVLDVMAERIESAESVELKEAMARALEAIVSKM